MKELIARFDAAVPDWDEPHAKPTSQSLDEIFRRLGLIVPSALIDFANGSKSFSSFFLSIGPDVENDAHIIAKNEYWRRKSRGKIPPQLVIFTNGHMTDDFWCFSTSSGSAGHYPIQYWTPGFAEPEAKDIYTGFEPWIVSTVEWHEKMKA